MSRIFPRTASVELLWEVVSRHRSSSRTYCCKHARGAPAILLPFAVLGMKRCLKPPQHPTEVLHMEGNLSLPGKRAEVLVPPSRVGCTVTEKQNQQQKGMGLLWPWIALCYAEGHSGTNLAKVLNLQVTSPIS